MIIERGKTMSNAFDQYLRIVQDLLSKIERAQIEKGAQLVVETIKNDRLAYVLGTDGHSYMAAEDMFYRAGGLVAVHPIFPSGFALSHGAVRSSLMERAQNYIGAVLEHEAPGPGDTLIVVNAYGINASTIEAVLKGKQLGAKIIAVTSTMASRSIPKEHPARHPSEKNLCDLKEVDVIIDSKMPMDDAVISFEGFDVKVSPVSTILNSFVLQALVGYASERLLAEGIKPPIWRSTNLPGGDEHNKKYVEAYSTRVKNL